MKTLIKSLVKKSVQRSPAYSCARSLVKRAKIFLDANENSLGSVLGDVQKIELNRYPDPLSENLRKKLAQYAKVKPAQVLVGNGSDEIIWLLLLGFVENNEEILTFTPTFSMYKVFAELAGLKVRELPLEKDFTLNVAKLLKKVSPKTKIIFLCSPNNPTAQTIPVSDINKVAKNFKGLVVVDEAYIEFAPRKSCQSLLRKYQNLVILRTFSKAWGLAGLRTGYALGNPEVISALAKVRAPYSVDALSQALAEKALTKCQQMEIMAKKIISERERLTKQLWELGLIVFPSDANFLLVKFPAKVTASRVYKKLVDNFGIVLRDFSAKPGLKNCIRVTVGSGDENRKLIAALGKVLKVAKVAKVAKVNRVS
ncbi:MAG: histidinol-phosphate transaminase [Patescibacteria group bacterium]